MIPSGTLVTPGTEADWLAARATSIGASDAPAVAGVCPYRTPIDVWQQKLGLAPPQEESEPMRWGKLLEPVVLAEYERRTGRKVEAPQLFLRHPDHVFLTATLDGVCSDGRLVEAKTAGAWAREWGDEGTDEVPDNYLIQCQHQMLVSGAEAVDLAVLVGGQRFRLFEVKRNAELVAAVLGRCLEFWRCVESRTPPDWGRVTAEGLLSLHPGCEGEVALTDSTAILVSMYEEARRGVQQSQAFADSLKLDILAALGTHQLGRLPDGRVLKRFVQRVEASTRTVTTKAHTRHYFGILKGDR